MKKLWVFVLTVLLVVGITGCSASQPKVDNPAETVKSGSETTYYQVEENQVGRLSVTIEKSSGRLDLHVFPVDALKRNAYTGTDLPSSAFTVELTEPGRYQVDLTTERFNGTYHLNWSVEELPSSPEPTNEELIGPWHLVKERTWEAIPCAEEFGASMELRSDGRMNWYAGAWGGVGTYTVEGEVVTITYTDDVDGTSNTLDMILTENAEGLTMTMETHDLVLLWRWGDDPELGLGGGDQG